MSWHSGRRHCPTCSWTGHASGAISQSTSQLHCAHCDCVQLCKLPLQWTHKLESLDPHTGVLGNGCRWCNRVEGSSSFPGSTRGIPDGTTSVIPVSTGPLIPSGVPIFIPVVHLRAPKSLTLHLSQLCPARSTAFTSPFCRIQLLPCISRCFIVG